MSDYSTPADFFRDHGLVVDHPIDDGRWHRVPTEDKPRHRNGAYILDGDRAACQNWAVMQNAVSWRSKNERPALTEESRRQLAARARDREETQERGWARAVAKAEEMLATARPGHHGYLMRKGFDEKTLGLVLPDGALFVPMRDLETNALRGAQLIRWVVDERVWEKKFLPGMRANGAVFRLGRPKAMETMLCEGLATGLSIEMAARSLNLNLGVLVCFSAGNLVNVAPRVKGKAFVFADNDASGTGQTAAEKTGLPWAMSPDAGADANDHHIKHGLRSLAGLLLDLRRRVRSPVEPRKGEGMEWKG